MMQMKLVNRTTTTLTMLLALGLAPASFAQETTESPSPTETPAATDPAVPASGPATERESQYAASDSLAHTSSYQTRGQLNQILSDYPPEVGRALSLQPSLLSNSSFLASYPELAAFLDQHPAVRNNPDFYLVSYRDREPRSAAADVLEGILILGTIGLGVFALTWLIRLFVEQRRWSRLSRTQTEVHNKILDRFGTSDELLEYIRSPAGSHFLESAPIPVRVQPEDPTPAPVSRILWSVQIGVVVGVAALGLMLVSVFFSGESSQAFLAMGAIGLAIGVGFVASAAVSYFLSMKLGLWDQQSWRRDSGEYSLSGSDVRS